MPSSRAPVPDLPEDSAAPSPDALDALLDDARHNMELPHELDLTARMASENMVFGLARLQAAIRSVDSVAGLSYQASLDLTITRTAKRWRFGMAYGGVLHLRRGDIDIALPDLRPNACGALVGDLAQPMDTDTMVQLAADVRQASGQLTWDYSRRNHFINLYRRADDPEGSGSVVVLHGCPADLRVDRPGRPGLYAHTSEYWRPRLQAVSTPFGTVQLLLGDDAEAFRQSYRRCEAASMQHRQDTAEQIFGDVEVTHNGTHAGLSGDELYFQGCHLAPPNDQEAIYPVLTRPGEPLFLVRPPSRADQPYIILPHGTGYRLPGVEGLKVQRVGQRPLFALQHGGGQAVYGDVASLPFDYRPSTLVEDWHRQGKLQIQERLDMVATLKL